MFCKCIISGNTRRVIWTIFLSILFLIVLRPDCLVAQPSEELMVDIENIYVEFDSLGSYVDLPIYIWTNSMNAEFDKIRLMLKYDTTVAEMYSAYRGELLEQANWPNPTIGHSLPGGWISLEFEADEGATGYLENSIGELAKVRFYIKEDSALECLAFPVSFYWMNCRDNIFYERLTDTVYMSDIVYDPIMGGNIQEDDTLPTLKGAPDSCLLNPPQGETALRKVDFHNGVIDIGCNDVIDQRGDLNLNNIPNEIADYVLYINYFLYGISAFDVNPPLQIAVSDINADGEVLTLRDLIYLCLIITGDVYPYPKSGMSMGTDTAVIVQDMNSGTISLIYPDSLAAAHFTFLGEIAPNEDSLGQKYILYAINSGITRVLISSDTGFDDSLLFGQGQLFTYTDSGRLTMAEVADYSDQPIPVRIERIGDIVVCGDANSDYIVNISDAVYVINFIFTGGFMPIPLESADVNCDEAVNISDVVSIVNYIFAGGNDPCDVDGDGIPDC